MLDVVLESWLRGEGISSQSDRGKSQGPTVEVPLVRANQSQAGSLV